MEKIMKKVVIKIGRSVATSKRNKVDEYRFEHLAGQIKILQEHNITAVLVVSAAVCCGEQQLNLKGAYSLTKQLVAGVGQAAIMAELHKIFKKHNLKIAQLLLTKHDLQNNQKRDRLSSIFSEAAQEGIVVIINENDIVELNSFDGNDHLAVEIAKITQANELVFLTDVEGLLDEKMRVINFYTQKEKLAEIVKVNHKGEVGGIKAKLDAAINASSNGIITWIANGRTQNHLIRTFLQNEHIGTKILGGTA